MGIDLEYPFYKCGSGVSGDSWLSLQQSLPLYGGLLSGEWKTLGSVKNLSRNLQSRGGGNFNAEPQTSTPATPAYDPNEEPF